MCISYLAEYARRLCAAIPMYYLYILAGAAFAASLIANRVKTMKALRMAWKKGGKMLPAFLVMLILVSLLPTQLSETVIADYFGQENTLFGTLFASLCGSVTILPGFIAFPLCGLLVQKGVPYMVLSAFSTTLMMVGIVTYPVERAYLGTKITIVRNLMSFGIALIVAVMTGLVFGEVLP